MATQQAGHARIDSLDSDNGRVRVAAAVTQVAQQLAQAIVRDGEGASKFITVQIDGGRDEAECKLAAYAIAHSPLVKTAFFASDPNLGRILAAVGYAGIADLDQTRIDLFLDDVAVVTDGGRRADYKEEDGARVMKQAEITVRVDLKRGDASATVWTCDLSVRLRQDQRRLPELSRLAARSDSRWRSCVATVALIWWWLPVGSAWRCSLFIQVLAASSPASRRRPALYTTLDVALDRRDVQPDRAALVGSRCPKCDHRYLRGFPWQSLKKVECGVCGYEIPEA